MKRNRLLIFVGIMFLISLSTINAGLIVEPALLNVSKTYGENVLVNITIRNTELFPFNNIEFENNPYISFPKISELSAGGNMSLIALVISNENIEEDLKIRGFYNGSVGVSNLIYEYNINKDLLDDCYSYLTLKEYNLIDGDTLKIMNNENVDLKVYTGTSLLTTIAPNSFYSIQGLELNKDYIYRFEYASHISSVPGYYCYVNVLMDDDAGLIHRDEYDGVVRLNLNTQYEKTNLTFNFPETSYTTDFFNSQDGFFMIKNDGDKIAKSVHLVGDWFNFNLNDFDIDVGQSKIITYTMKPIVFNTTDTNKTYNKTITATGNFNTFNQEFSIFVNYAEVNSENLGGGSDLFKLIEEYCAMNPDVCNTEPRVIYKNINDSESYFNVTFGNQQVKQIFTDLYNFIEEQRTINTYNKERFDSLSYEMNNTNLNSANSVLEIKSIDEKLDSMNAVWSVIAGIIFTIICCLLLGSLILYYKNRNNKIQGGKL